MDTQFASFIFYLFSAILPLLQSQIMITFGQNEENLIEWGTGKGLERSTKSLNLQFLVLSAIHGITTMHLNRILIIEVSPAM